MRKMPEIKYRLKNGQELTEDQIKEVEASRDIPITFGDDSPEIDPVKTPQQNLGARFKEYRKLKGAREHLSVLIEDGEKQLDYLESVLEELSRAETGRELEEIRTELRSTGWLKVSGQKQKPQKKKAAPGKVGSPLSYRSPGGLEILVGRNNTQNDELTLHIARRTDYWFHVKNLHGSHVILRCEGMEPSEADVTAAAGIAAFYSQARESGHIAVDYTMVRNVKKPSGALPGKVIYQSYRTVIADAKLPEGEGEIL